MKPTPGRQKRTVLAWKSRAARLQRTHLSSIKHQRIRKEGVSLAKQEQLRQGHKPAHLSSNTRVSKKVVLALQTRTPIIKHPGVKEGGGRPTKPHTYHETPGSRGRWCWPYKPAHCVPIIKHQGVEEGGVGPTNPHTCHRTPGCRRRWCWPYEPAHCAPIIKHQGVEEGGAGPINPHTAHLSSNTRVSKKVVLALRMSAWSMMGAAEAANAFRYTRATTLSDTFLCTCVGKCQGKTKTSMSDHTIFGHLPLHVCGGV